MKRFLCPTASGASMRSAWRPVLRCCRTGLRYGLAALALGLFLVAPALADTCTGIYIYDSGGNPVNVTSTYFYQEHHVYDPSNNLVGTVDDNDQIENGAGQTVGYVTLAAD